MEDFKNQNLMASEPKYWDPLNDVTYRLQVCLVHPQAAT